ncbi:MAG: glycosyltransferase [Acidobacteriota bacterium]
MIEKGLIPTVEDYAQFVGQERIEKLKKKSENLKGLHIAHVSSTFYGGGVAELLSSLTILMNDLGIKAGWRVIQGSPDFFSITKKMHNALQSGEINMTEMKLNIYEEVIFENSIRNHLHHDVVIIHDPQPLAMVQHYKRKGPWIWRCHLDLSNPNPEVWEYLVQFIEMYDAVVLSLEDYRQKISPPQVFFMPAIDPFSIKNRELSEEEMMERLKHYDIPTDLPLLVQISRFDRWKDPEGVIKAFKMIRREVDCTLVLLGNVATDDPEGEDIYQSILDEREERIIILSKEDTALVNALQSKAAVVIQKSLREGFGLTVTEAMWKGTPVVGGNVGGIRYQINDGENGFLVSSIEETAEKTIALLKNEELRREMAKKAREKVKEEFLMIRLLEQYVDFFNAFETVHRLNSAQV